LRDKEVVMALRGAVGRLLLARWEKGFVGKAHRGRGYAVS